MNAELAMRTIEALEPYARRLLERAADEDEAYCNHWFLAISQARLVVKACDAPRSDTACVLYGERAMNINERRIFGCQYGDNHYLDVRVIGDNELVSVIITDWPVSFWRRIKRLFKREACQYEILLTPEQAQELAAVLATVGGVHPLSTLVEGEWEGTSGNSTWKGGKM